MHLFSCWSGTFYRVKSATGRTELAVTAEGQPTFATAVKGTAKGWSPAMDHLRDVLPFHISWMAGKFINFVIITKNVL